MNKLWWIKIGKSGRGIWGHQQPLCTWLFKIPTTVWPEAVPGVWGRVSAAKEENRLPCPKTQELFTQLSIKILVDLQTFEVLILLQVVHDLLIEWKDTNNCVKITYRRPKLTWPWVWLSQKGDSKNTLLDEEMLAESRNDFSKFASEEKH